MLRSTLPTALRGASHRCARSLIIRPSLASAIIRFQHTKQHFDFAQHKIPSIRIIDNKHVSTHAVNQSAINHSHSVEQSIPVTPVHPHLDQSITAQQHPSNVQPIDQPLTPEIEILTAPTLKQQLNLDEWSKLVKFELSVLAASSCIFGYYLAGGSLLAILSVNGGLMLGGTVLNAFSAIILNQIIERKYDAMMERTRRRPLVIETISIPAATAGCVGFASAGAAALFMASGGGLAAPAIALSTVVLYAYVYTPLKRKTVWNTEVGALVGSLPVWVGAACALPAAELVTLTPATLAVWLGFAFMSVWQMPHFMMIAYQYAAQYKRAGFIMRSPAEAPKIGLWYTASFLLLPVLGFHLQVTSPSFIITGTFLSLYLLVNYSRFVANPSVYKARGPIYIFFVFMFAAICMHANSNDDIDNIITKCLTMVDRYIMKLPDCILNWQNLKPAAMKDNRSFWQSLPGFVHSVCGKSYHDRMMRDHTLPGACPIVHVQRTQQGNTQVAD